MDHFQALTLGLNRREDQKCHKFSSLSRYEVTLYHSSLRACHASYLLGACQKLAAVCLAISLPDQETGGRTQSLASLTHEKRPGSLVPCLYASLG
jgi:hypothetical protein